MRLVRRGVMALVLAVAVMPVTAHAEDGNQIAIDKARAEQQWLIGLPALERGVAMGQREIANARAIARLLNLDRNAQSQIPNSMEMYRAFCAQAIVKLQANLDNARTMVDFGMPGDAHAQAELVNAQVKMRELWEMIGDSYPGNPYRVYSDEPTFVADDEGLLMAEDESLLIAEDEDLVIADAEQLDVAAFVDDGGN